MPGSLENNHWVIINTPKQINHWGRLSSKFEVMFAKFVLIQELRKSLADTEDNGSSRYPVCRNNTLRWHFEYLIMY